MAYICRLVIGDTLYGNFKKDPMPVKLRLRRQGRKKSPHYAIVAADSRAPRDGRYIEKIGHYNPVKEPARVFVDHELALKWLKVGAQPTHTVRSLLRHSGITLKFALIKQGKSEEEMERIFNRWWEEKQSKKKKKVIQVDVHGTPLEQVPEIEKAEHQAASKVEEAAAVAEEAAAPAEATPEETPVEEAPAAEAPAEEAKTETSEAETPDEEAPAAEETPAKEEETTAEEASEEKKEEAPAAE